MCGFPSFGGSELMNCFCGSLCSQGVPFKKKRKRNGMV